MITNDGGVGAPSGAKAAFDEAPAPQFGAEAAAATPATAIPVGASRQEPPPPGEADNSAWVKIEMPLEPVLLHDFLSRLERTFRINPFLEFERVAREGDDDLRLIGRNESNEQRFDVRVRVTARVRERRLVLRYDGGIKRETRFDFERAAAGSVLTITETYDPPRDGERDVHLRQIDRSLVPWAAALRKTLLRRARWGWLPGYRWVTGSFWLGMTPRQRRIGTLIAWISLLEFVVFLFVVAIFWSETRGG